MVHRAHGLQLRLSLPRLIEREQRTEAAMTTNETPPQGEPTRKNWQEELNATGDELINRVKGVVTEGNVRRIIIKQDDRTLVELPLTIGVVGVLLAPQLAAIGAIAALVTRCTIAVEREGSHEDSNPDSSNTL
jgi:Domain of unknown function (DUF4342)